MAGEFETARCPRCGKTMGRNVVICVDCGINIETGQRLGARVSVEEAEEPDETEETVEAAGFVQRWAAYFHAVFPGMRNPLLVSVSVLVMVMGVGFLAFGLVLALVVIVPFEGVAISGVGLVLWAQAWGWVMVDEWSVMPDTFLDFDEERWWAFAILMVLPIAGMILLMLLVPK